MSKVVGQCAREVATGEVEGSNVAAGVADDAGPFAVLRKGIP